MSELGTAPRRVNGIWRTRTGRQLTPAGQRYWDQQQRLGITDGLGHMKPQGPRLQAGVTYKKPGFDTILKASRGDKAALAQVRRHELHLRAVKQAEAQTNRLVSGQFGGVEQIAMQAHKVVNPVAGAVIQALSPYTAGKEATVALGRGNLPAAGLAAMGIFPFGRGARAGRAIKAGLEAEKAAQEAAKVEKVVKVAKAAVTPEQQVLRATGAGRRAYAEQAELRSAERSKRAAQLGYAFEAAGGGEKGVLAKLGVLKGELPSVRFDKLTNLDEHTMKRLLATVETHPDLQELEKLSLQTALRRVHAGMVPRPFEIKLVERVFGPAKAAEMTAPFTQHMLHTAAEIVNAPRSILASADVSAPFRQALLASVHNPRAFAKNLGPMFHYLVSEKNYAQVMHGIETDPLYGQMVDDGVRFTGLGDLAHREEYFMSNLAEKITGGKYSFVRASSRAYVGFLNKLRADLYKSLVDDAEAVGEWAGPKTGRDIAHFVNVATGRGGLGPLEKSAVPLNTVFFAPRLLASRFETFAMPFYPNLDPFVRKQAAIAAARLVAAGTTILGISALAGAKVVTDPRNADWGKVRVGNTRFDIWGGHQQLARLFAQIGSGKIVSSTTGKTLALKGGYGGMSRQDILKRFAEGKLAPTPSLINDWFRGTDFADKPFSWKKAVVSRSYPLLVQDMLDIYHGTGSPLLAAGGYGIGAFGIGVQTYGPKKPKGRRSRGSGEYSDPFANVFESGGGGYSDPFANLTP